MNNLLIKNKNSTNKKPHINSGALIILYILILIISLEPVLRRFIEGGSFSLSRHGGISLQFIGTQFLFDQ
jgi:hypothetical protein